VRIALIGCGEVARAKHLPALMHVSRARVVAVCDVDAARRARVAAEFGVPFACAGIEDVLSRGDVDAVGICTEPEAHAEPAIAALRARKHVLVEKPLALSAAQCQAMIAAAEEAGVVAMTGFHMRFHRLVRQLRDLIRRGAAGEVESVRVVWHSPRGDEGIPDWKTRRSRGGGAVVEISVHHLDLVRFLTDSDIEEVFAFSRRGVRDDECAVISARTSSGILVAGEFSERSPHEIEIVVNGREGQLRADCLRFDGLAVRGARDLPGAPEVRLRSALRSARAFPAGLGIQRRGGDYRISYQREWEHFVQAVAARATPEVTFIDGLRAVEAVGAAVESILTGRAVRVRAAGTGNGPAVT
jgi:predicted dehydrogenase